MKSSDVFIVVCFCAAVGFFGWALLRALDRPEVIMSYSTGECRRVDLADGTHGDCSKLPERYDIVWGK